MFPCHRDCLTAGGQWGSNVPEFSDLPLSLTVPAYSMTTRTISTPPPPLRRMREPIKVLLLENVHTSANEMFATEGFSVEALPLALKPEQLADRIRDVQVLGIRSKTQI